MEARFTEAPPRRGRRANLTPMVDVLFLLVVFFLLAARFGAEGALALAAGGRGPGGWDGPPRLVTVLPEGAALNGVPMADAALAAALAPLMPAAGAPVIVRPGEGVALQRLVDVIEALAGGGEAAGQRGRAEAAGAGEAARAAWAAAVRARIERAKAWPQGAAGASGRVALIIRIGADGRLLGAVVAQGSGDAALDAAAVAAVRRAAPFPPAPAGVPGAAFRLTIRFDR